MAEEQQEKQGSRSREALAGISCCLTRFGANGNMKSVVNISIASTGGRWPVAAPAIVCAEVAELADALHSGCSARKGVEVRVLSSAPLVKKSPEQQRIGDFQE